MNKILSIINNVSNATSCQNKWGWSTIFLNTGSSASCHRCKHYFFDEETIMDFHNLPGKLEDRQKMLDGEWPGNGCEYCRDIEKVGGVSDRIPFNGHTTILPQELLENPTQLKVLPTILEVYFNNTCNQACVYCRPRFSSQIESEVRKFGPSQFNTDYNDIENHNTGNYSTYLNKFFEWLKLYGHSLLTFKMLGGEPLYQKEFDMMLDFLDENPLPNLQWDIFTNLKHDNDKFLVKINKIKKLLSEKKIKGIQFICSMDCWGPDVEYVRYGFNMEVAEKNMNLLLETEGVDVQVHATISALSIPSMYLLGEKIREWKNKKPVVFHWNTIVNPNCFDIYNFGSYFVDYVDKFINTLDTPVPENQRTILGIKNRMLNSTVNKEQVSLLYGYLNELDLRRNENWKERFPEVAEIIKRIINDV
jgi:organic radical activating enzyme